VYDAEVEVVWNVCICAVFTGQGWWCGVMYKGTITAGGIIWLHEALADASSTGCWEDVHGRTRKLSLLAGRYVPLGLSLLNFLATQSRHPEDQS
jgi:hypothetical protein